MLHGVSRFPDCDHVREVVVSHVVEPVALDLPLGLGGARPGEEHGGVSNVTHADLERHRGNWRKRKKKIIRWKKLHNLKNKIAKNLLFSDWPLWQLDS